MGDAHTELDNLRRELAEVKQKLRQAEETLQAIRSGEVDAVVVSTKEGERIFTLQGADYTYQLLVEQMGEGAATISGEGLILYCNHRLSELLNCPLKNLIGSQLETFIAPQDRKILELLLQEMPNEETLTRELSLVTAREHKEIPVKLSLKQFKVDDLVVKGIVITDITESKIKEAAKLSQILNSAIAVIENFRLFSDGKLQIDSWIGGTQQIFGYSLEAIQANADFMMTHILPEDREKALTSLIDNIQTRHSGIIEYRFLHGDRTIHWLSSNHVAEWDEAQGCWIGIEIITDITEKKQLEKQIYHAQRLESLGTLASGIAHDFNNILTPILGVSQLLPLTLPNLDDKAERLLTLLCSNARRGADLVKQILLFGRDTEGEIVVLQLSYLLLELISIAQQTFPKSITIVSEIPTEELWTISADTTQIHQVFMNLMVNARDAMPEGGILTIIAENRQLDQHYAQINLEAKVGAYVVVTIGDTGIGISPELKERIFDPFFTTKGVGQGTGLGLSTVRGIVKNYGGFIMVYSELGKGTKFEVFFPANQEKVSLKISEEILPRGDGQLVLIVDDETAIQEITKASLEKYNYRTMVASDGKEALSIFAENQQEISVILMDIMMPNLDGITTIRTLKQINPLVKIIATSGLLTNKQLASEVDVKTFLLKPYTASQLLQALSEVIGTKPIYSNQNISETIFDNIELLKQALATMPPKWLEQMYQGAYSVDADIMLELITQIPDSEVVLINTLTNLVDNFKTEIVMELIGSLLVK